MHSRCGGNCFADFHRIKRLEQMMIRSVNLTNNFLAMGTGTMNFFKNPPDPERIARSYYEALAANDADGIFNLLTDDVVFNISGHTPLSGRIQGKERFRRDVAPHIFGALSADFRFCTRWKIVCADSRRVVGIMEADGTGNNGRRYDQRYMHMFAFRDYRICEVWEFLDTALAIAVLFPPEAAIPRPEGMTEFSF